MESFKNYYHTLGVASTADEAAIKAAFRRLARRHHPDIAQDKRGARRFLEIREAYDVLSDPERRRQYDHVYRAHTALRMIEADVERRKKRTPREARAGGFGLHLDVLGLNVSLSVGAEARRPAPRKQSRFRRRRPRRPQRSAQ
jgi:DnaJ-class molecular chaperone